MSGRRVPVLPVLLAHRDRVAPKTAIPVWISSILYETIDVRGEEATGLSSVVINRFVIVFPRGWLYLTKIAHSLASYFSTFDHSR